jgi:hypothetical protein
MSVQNGERPVWAWSGQQVEVATGWEVTTPAPGASNGAADANGVDTGPPQVEIVGQAAGGRPSWAWGGGERPAEAAAPAAAPEAPAAAPDTAPAWAAASGTRPAWSWDRPGA